MVNRLMVMAELLTYRLDLPQEGSASVIFHDKPVELRVAIMPTTHGLRCAVRLPAELLQPKTLADLGLPLAAIDGIKRFIAAPSGMLAVTGPAGAGKTTTLYAILQDIQASAPGQSIVTLEDPVERDLPGITQIQVQPFGQLTYERALRSILRQDPQVLMLGEIRDAATASLAVQASLTGHKLLCTLHAPTCAQAIARLLEMGIEPYQISSSLFGVLSQRLLRKINTSPEPKYKGRVPVAEWVAIDDTLRKLIAAKTDAATIERAYAEQPGYATLAANAADCIQTGETDAAEVHRVLG
jgi:type II secretory ATPase GspE/PulE/Tfp pilus assembly ATPase PilB-like protein